MRGQQVYVVGAGNSAGQAAIHLSKHAAGVTLLVRGEALEASMSDYLIREIGATPYIALRVHSKEATKRAPASPAWSKLFHLYNYRRDEFLAHYHARSNAESTFSSMKRVFGDTLRSKTFPAQVNELLLKVIAHNIVCVVHSVFELGIPVPGCTQNPAPAHNLAS